MNKELLEKYLSEGKSTRKISELTGVSRSNISYWITKHELNEQSIYSKNLNFNFEKIDTKAKAYVLGFMLADGAIKNNDVEISIAIADKEVADYIASVICANVHCDYTLNIKQRRFPRARLVKRIKDISKFTGGERKQDRHYPRVREDLEKYLMLGLFDADGCITWGLRKDKGRLWQKINITSSLKILSGVQQYLINKLDISTIVRPKSGEDCYIIEFSNKKDVLKFLDHIYSDKDFIILKRKYLKANALRLELEENGGSIE